MEDNINPSRYNAELNSTVLSPVPGPVWSQNHRVIQQCFLLVFPKLCYPVAAFES
jgi:hypothetical protein